MNISSRIMDESNNGLLTLSAQEIVDELYYLSNKLGLKDAQLEDYEARYQNLRTEL